MTVERSPGEWNLAVRQQAAVAHLGQIGLQTVDLEELIRETMITAADTLGVTDAALFELQPSWTELRGRAALEDGRFLSRRSMAKVVVPAGRGSLLGFAIDLGAPVVADDLVADERFTARAPERGVPVRSAIAAPIGWDTRPFGVLAVYDRVLRAWTDDEVHFVQSVANTMGLAIQRARIEAELRDSSTRLDLSLSAGGLGAWSWDFEGDRVVLNASALAMYGLAPSSFGGRGRELIALIHPEDRLRYQQVRVPADVEAEHHDVFRIVRPDTGEVRWLESWGRQISPDRGMHLVGVVSDITERRRAEQVQEAILEREHAARVEAERARERLSFLSEASAVLGSSLDPEVTLTQFAELCVPAIADVAFVDLVDDDGLLHERAGRATSEALLAEASALRSRRAELGPAAPTASGHLAALAGQGVIVDQITDELLEQAAADPAHLAALAHLDARSTIIAPLVSRGRSLGVLTLVRVGPDAEPYAEADDLPFVEELASRAALAIDNGSLYRSRARVARSLQDALLPPALPEIEGLALAARYDVAEADLQIGGDFYDVIPVAPRRWGVVVGDVCGRGPDAAALTGLVRHTLRSAVVDEHLPSRVLERTNQAVLDQIDDARFCTAAYLEVDLSAGRPDHVRVTASSAGHPRPVLVRSDGTVEALACAGTLLGVVDEPLLVDVTVDLGPGDAVVLYTDGVTEARRGLELFGEERLSAVLAVLAGRSAEDLAGGLEAAVAEFRRSARDDSAIVVVQAVPPR